MSDRSRRVPLRTLDGEPIEGVEHLVCLVCGHDHFRYHEDLGTRMLTAKAIDLSGAKRSYGYACSRCGFLHWSSVKR